MKIEVRIRKLLKAHGNDYTPTDWAEELAAYMQYVDELKERLDRIGSAERRRAANFVETFASESFRRLSPKDKLLASRHLEALARTIRRS